MTNTHTCKVAGAYGTAEGMTAEGMTAEGMTAGGVTAESMTADCRGHDCRGHDCRGCNCRGHLSISLKHGARGTFIVMHLSSSEESTIMAP